MSGIRLNRALTLEALQRTPDGGGGHVETWVALGRLWAEVRPGTGRETDGEEFPLALVGYRITVRSAPPGAPSRPRAGQRFREGGRSFAILAVTEREGEGQYLTCFAKEEDPA